MTANIKDYMPKGIVDGEFIEKIESIQSAMPSKEAYLIKPKDVDYIEINKKYDSESIRRIFEIDINRYTKYEIDKIKEFKNFIKFKVNYTDTDKFDYISNSTLLRFLQATQFNFDKSAEYLKNFYEWRNTFFPITITNNLKTLLNSGFIYSFGKDSKHRPIIVINTIFYINNESKYTYDEWLNCIIFFMEYFVHNLTIPGQIENWIIITDLRNVSLWSLPSNFKEILKVMTSTYRARLYINYLLGMNFVLRGLWKVIKLMLDPNTAQKIRILGDSDFTQILDQINPYQLEKKFGGKCENIISDFFPPRSPNNNNVIFDNVDKKELFYNDNEYRELYKSQQLVTVSPYLLKEIEIENKNSNSKNLFETGNFNDGNKSNFSDKTTQNISNIDQMLDKELISENEKENISKITNKKVNLDLDLD